MQKADMKSIWKLISSIFQLLVGVLAIAAFIVLMQGGEDVTRWIITVVLAFGYVIMGIMGIIEWCRK
jgi:carbon starvation protein CstA